MNKHLVTTEVLFRVDTTKDFKGEIFALMPYEIWCGYNVTSYQHVGQHSAADYQHCLETSRPATEMEYTDLKKEMEGLGYIFKVIKKYNHAKYLEAVRIAKNVAIIFAD